MKKAVYLFLLTVVLISLCGCDDGKDEFNLRPFRCNVQLSCQGISVDGVFVYEDKNSMCLEFSSDERMDGIGIAFRDGVYTYICDEVSAEIHDNGINAHAFGLFSAVGLLSESDVEIKADKDNTFSLSGDGKVYTYTVDGRDGKLLRIKTESGEIRLMY